ncbi:hypothetical protein QBC35DRAFT_67914 [Podospora australis]|uniref:Uncharacterized protein n=1 Tax=Podospora australis TaxID=1536484 RepID=A0AAN6WPK6_9PEZI|nr:hypothetical protein QBC35DRAFT_67914 [Podospora australis]
MATTILGGFKVSVAAFDRFLGANNLELERTYGNPPFAHQHPDGPISQLLFRKVSTYNAGADKNGFRVTIPTLSALPSMSKTAYVSYTWTAVRAHRELELEEDLPAEIPKGFEELRQEIPSFEQEIGEDEEITNAGKMGLYLVVNDDALYSGSYPLEGH